MGSRGTEGTDRRDTGNNTDDKELNTQAGGWAPADYTTIHYTTLHYTTLHYTTLHYTIDQDINDQGTTAILHFGPCATIYITYKCM